ncbi:uncharacterized protein SCHCODRAFT_02608842 [Schizophyllum commune H4-8]|uniref:uncharacterized protein n=1 Tax=Schizophyllum commune (strain H4-8 / FGSC 9210) TaxID=578458 RepID=UPI0021606895|nr:uncharacterized protein SCHCODRAFT_02608842 [Schizophyllum commune H4-8]KAI5900809.1 hypothetical protein SCHCODRAFT_02608842 [Schizophyllum commune H4-8]
MVDTAPGHLPYLQPPWPVPPLSFSSPALLHGAPVAPNLPCVYVHIHPLPGSFPLLSSPSHTTPSHTRPSRRQSISSLNVLVLTFSFPLLPLMPLSLKSSRPTSSSSPFRPSSSPCLVPQHRIWCNGQHCRLS